MYNSLELWLYETRERKREEKKLWLYCTFWKFRHPTLESNPKLYLIELFVHNPHPTHDDDVQNILHKSCADKLDSTFSRSRSSSMCSLENVSSESVTCLAFADSYTKKSGKSIEVVVVEITVYGIWHSLTLVFMCLSVRSISLEIVLSGNFTSLTCLRVYTAWNVLYWARNPLCFLSPHRACIHMNEKRSQTLTRPYVVLFFFVFIS